MERLASQVKYKRPFPLPAHVPPAKKPRPAVPDTQAAVPALPGTASNGLRSVPAVATPTLSPAVSPKASPPVLSASSPSTDHGIGDIAAENETLKLQIIALKETIERKTASASTLLARLSKREGDIAALTAALQDQARQINPELDSTKRKLLDPTLNLLVRAMRKELAEKNKKMEELQQEVLGNNFTPYSIPGKKLVAKLRALQQENEELGKQLCQGRVEQLQIELALQKKANERLKDQLKEADKMAVNLDEEAETMQSIIFNLKAKVRWYEDRYGQITQDDDGAGIKAERDGVTDVKGKTKSSVGGDERSDERLDSGRRTAWSATPDSEQGRGRYVGVRTTPDLAPAKEEKMESDTRKDGKT